MLTPTLECEITKLPTRRPSLHVYIQRAINSGVTIETVLSVLNILLFFISLFFTPPEEWNKTCPNRMVKWFSVCSDRLCGNGPCIGTSWFSLPLRHLPALLLHTPTYLDSRDVKWFLLIQYIGSLQIRALGSKKPAGLQSFCNTLIWQKRLDKKGWQVFHLSTSCDETLKGSYTYSPITQHSRKVHRTSRSPA